MAKLEREVKRVLKSKSGSKKGKKGKRSSTGRSGASLEKEIKKLLK
ncbi:MAG TPA: hypothetical protein VFJ72_16675 [Rubrobacteraceae bacterium]|nr:hypothetical protein [Rubrobacteraceae bacterium]